MGQNMVSSSAVRRILLVLAVMATIVAAMAVVMAMPAFARSNHASSNAEFGSNKPCYHEAYFQLEKCLHYP